MEYFDAYFAVQYNCLVSKIFEYEQVRGGNLKNSMRKWQVYELDYDVFLLALVMEYLAPWC